jgi:hypothetical protein
MTSAAMGSPAARGSRRGHTPRLRMEKRAGSNRPDALEASDASCRNNRRSELMACVSAPSSGHRRSECRCGHAARTNEWIGHDNLQVSALSSAVRNDHDSHLIPTAELRQLSGLLEDHVQLGQLARSTLHTCESAGQHACQQPLAPGRWSTGPSRHTGAALMGGTIK